MATSLSVLIGVLCCWCLMLSVAPAASASTTATVSGEVTAATFGSVTISTGAKDTGSIDAMVTEATRLAAHDYPYVYGGGHAHAGQASTGGKGHSVGYDCSGAVAAVLAAGGLWPKNSAVPSDVGMIAALKSRKLISRGPGSGPDAVTLYDVPGHIQMTIAGNGYGTGGDSRGGPGWLGSDVGSLKGVNVYHFSPSLFRKDPPLPDTLTVQYGFSTADELAADGIATGEKVTVGYAPSSSGTLNITSVSFAGALSASGIVTDIAASGDSLVLMTASGQELMLVAPAYPYANWFGFTNIPPTLIQPVDIGDTVTATYTSAAATEHTPAELIAHTLKITSTPPTQTVTGAISSEASNGMSFTLQSTTGQSLNFVFKRSYIPGEENLNPLQGCPVGTRFTIKYVAAPDGLAQTVLTYAFASP